MTKSYPMIYQNFIEKSNLKNENIQEDDSFVRNNSYFQPPKGRNQSLDEYIEITKVIPQNGTK